jgi:hypothetical protein
MSVWVGHTVEVEEPWGCILHLLFIDNVSSTTGWRMMDPQDITLPEHATIDCDKVDAIASSIQEHNGGLTVS